MRVFAGYVTVISFMLIFFTTLFFATDEVEQSTKLSTGIGACSEYRYPST